MRKGKQTGRKEPRGNCLSARNARVRSARFGYFVNFMLIFDEIIIAESVLPCYTIDSDTFFNPTKRGQK